MEAELLNVKQVTEYLGISKVTLYALIRGGQFPRGIKFGGSRRWSAADIKDWADGLKDKEAVNEQ